MRKLFNGHIKPLMCAGWLAGAIATAQADDPREAGNAGSYTVELNFSTHLELRLPEQDVFVERDPGSGEVYRVTVGQIDLDAPLFKAARPVPRNPFDARAVGPHPKGAAFGMTLGEWLQHRGGARISCHNGIGQLEAEFSGLVANGIYTLWHAFTVIPPTTPFSGFLEIPLGARDGSTSVFVAGRDGVATVRRRFEPCLQLSGLWTTSLLAINYHSDGKTYAGSPGAFGYNTHIPLFLRLPPRNEFR